MQVFNRNARREYFLEDSLEAGLVLSGAEVKSVRLGKVDLSEAFAKITGGEVFLKNCYIYPYIGARSDYDPRRDRKLLLHKSQIAQLEAKLRGGKYTLVPIRLYNAHNILKMEIALGSTKKKYDHRKDIKKRDEERKIQQELKGV